MTVLAFDLGGTRLKAGVVDPTARAVLRSEVRDTPEGSHALDELVAAGSALLDDEQITAVGLAVPGLVEEGRVTSLPGKLDGLVGIDLAGGLGGAFGAPAVVINDAVAYGLGEAIAGAGRGSSRVVVMTIGTGVGTAVIDGGVPITRGLLGGGILGGQIPISDATDGPADTSGRHGTIEALCRARRLTDLTGLPDVPAVFDAAARGDASARGAIATVRADLIRALVALAHAHAPAVIVVGGGPIPEDGGPLLDGVQDAVRARLFAGYSVDVRPAALGDGAALIGVARMALVHGSDR